MAYVMGVVLALGASLLGAVIGLDRDRAFYPIRHDTGSALILVPADVRRHLPVANSWEDIDLVASHNAALRAAVNPIIGDTWRTATGPARKKNLRKVLLENPELLGDLLDQYKKKGAPACDIKNDPDALQLWHVLAGDLAAGTRITPKAVIRIVQRPIDSGGSCITTMDRRERRRRRS